MIRSKFALIWYLILPLVLFFIYNLPWVSNIPDSYTFFYQSSLFISYITLVMSIDVTTSLISLRESGFLKMFKFVSGSKYSMILGKLITQIFFLLLAILIFSLITGVIFLSDINILRFIFTVLVASLIGGLSVSLLLLNLMFLPIKQESLLALLNISLLIMFLLSANNQALQLGYLLIFINPLEYIRNLTFIFAEMFTGMDFNHFNSKYIIFISCAYLILGIAAIKWINIKSPTYRT